MPRMEATISRPNPRIATTRADVRGTAKVGGAAERRSKGASACSTAHVAQRKITTSFSCPPAINDQLSKLAKSSGWPKSSVIEAACAVFLGGARRLADRGDGPGGAAEDFAGRSADPGPAGGRAGNAGVIVREPEKGTGMADGIDKAPISADANAACWRDDVRMIRDHWRRVRSASRRLGRPARCADRRSRASHPPRGRPGSAKPPGRLEGLRNHCMSAVFTMLLRSP